MRPQIISPYMTTRETMAVWENSEEEFSEAWWHVGKGVITPLAFDRTSGQDVPSNSVWWNLVHIDDWDNKNEVFQELGSCGEAQKNKKVMSHQQNKDIPLLGFNKHPAILGQQHQPPPLVVADFKLAALRATCLWTSNEDGDVSFWKKITLQNYIITCAAWVYTL